MLLIRATRHVRNLFSQIHEDWHVHSCDWTRPGFRAVAVQRFGAMLKDRKRGMLWWVSSVLYRHMFRYIRNHYGIELYDTTIVGRRFWITHQTGIVIHPNAVIGDDCVIHQNCTIGAPSNPRCSEAPKLGDRVELACGASIIGNVVIGDDVRIGPNVAVMTNIPAGVTVCTQPPRLIKLPLAQSRPLSNRPEQRSLEGKEQNGHHVDKQH